MFTLVTAKCKFFRVKRGQSGEEIEAALKKPVPPDAFGGKIIETDGEYTVYEARPFDSYKTVAERFGIAEKELEEANFSRIIYPTRKLFVPCKK